MAPGSRRERDHIPSIRFGHRDHSRQDLGAARSSCRSISSGFAGPQFIARRRRRSEALSPGGHRRDAEKRRSCQDARSLRRGVPGALAASTRSRPSAEPTGTPDGWRFRYQETHFRGYSPPRRSEASWRISLPVTAARHTTPGRPGEAPPGCRVGNRTCGPPDRPSPEAAPRGPWPESAPPPSSTGSRGRTGHRSHER